VSLVDSRYSTLVFDLDGTLTDPRLGIVRCVNHALQTRGFATVPDEDVVRHIGPPLDEAFHALVPSASPAVVKDLVAGFRDRYASVGFRENEVFPAIPGAIARLAGAGRRLGVCTSKRGDFAEKILALFGLLESFAFVDGGDIGITKGEQLARLLSAGIIDRDAVMIGDRDADIRAARANGLASIAVLWGFAAAGEIVAAAPTHTVATTGELLACVGAPVSPDTSGEVSLRPVAPPDLATIDGWASGTADLMSRTRPLLAGADRHDPGAGLFWYVILENGRDVGTVWIELLPGEPEAVLGIFLGEATDLGRGLGSQGIALAVAEFRRTCGHVPVTLRVRRSNARAVACYRHAGFAVTGSGSKTSRSGAVVPYFRMVLPPERVSTRTT
jgi:phosphoglycolate phosphatase